MSPRLGLHLRHFATCHTPSISDHIDNRIALRGMHDGKFATRVAERSVTIITASCREAI